MVVTVRRTQPSEMVVQSYVFVQVLIAQCSPAAQGLLTCAQSRFVLFLKFFNAQLCLSLSQLSYSFLIINFRPRRLGTLFGPPGVPKRASYYKRPYDASSMLISG